MFRELSCINLVIEKLNETKQNIFYPFITISEVQMNGSRGKRTGVTGAEVRKLKV